MKRILLTPCVLASIFMAGCSQNDELATDGADKATGYMAINLKSSDDNTYDGSPTPYKRAAASGFEDGLEAENAVTSVRFYFFNAAGGVAYVKAESGKNVNYYDWTPGETETDMPNDDIEKRYKAVIVINTNVGDQIPQMMAAVLNPTETTKARGNLSLSQLQAITRDYAASESTQNGKFVMFNSVYKGEDGKAVVAVPIGSENIAKTEEEAKLHPVRLYVERGVAKVSVNINLDGYTDGLLALKDSLGTDITVESNTGGTREQVFLKLEGWELTSETDKGRLVKKINPDWNFDWIQNPSYKYRSCWAINAMDANNKYNNHLAKKAQFNTECLYTNENAQLNDIGGAQGKAQHRTKVKISGLLCKKDGTPLTIVRHQGAHFVDTYDGEDEDKNLPLLKKSILNQLVIGGGKTLYTTKDGLTFDAIKEEDVKIQIVNQTNQEDKNNKGVNCYVVAQLSEKGKAKKWYSTDDKATYAQHPVDNATINKYLYDPAGDGEVVDQALVWREGMTYYYYEIWHNKDGRQPGVVRNHIYKTRVTKIAGLGTPVYDPSQTIYPEKPDPNDSFVAAEIDILSWHVVTDDYELNW